MDIPKIKNTLIAELSTVSSVQSITHLELSYLGRNGKINELLKGIKHIENFHN